MRSVRLRGFGLLGGSRYEYKQLSKPTLQGATCQEFTI